MSQRAIITGWGPIGSRVATILGDYGYDPIVIEHDTDRSEQFQDTHCAVTIDGDATRPDIIDLEDEGDLLVVGETDPSKVNQFLGAGSTHVTLDTDDPAFVIRSPGQP